jgi:hypothetical protein
LFDLLAEVFEPVRVRHDPTQNFQQKSAISTP